MSGIGGITTARVELATTTFTQTSATTLLPAPNTGVDVSDAVTQLLMFSSRLSEQQMVTGKAQVETAAAAREHAAELRKEALARAVEAARKAREAQESELFSFVTDRLGAAGLIGLATFNWGLIAADMSAHEAGVAPKTGAIDLGAAVFGGPLAYLAVRGAEELAPEGLGQTAAAATLLGGPLGLALERAAAKLAPGKLEKLEGLASIKDDDVRLANKVALAIALAAVACAGTVCTGGTSAPAIVALVGIGISTTTQVTAMTGALEEVLGKKAAGYVAMGGAITGAALTLGGSVWTAASAAKSAVSMAKSVQTLGKTIRNLDTARQLTEGTHAVISGIRQLEAADHQRDADLANVDAEAQRHVLQRIEKMIDGILEDLREAKDSAQRSAETLHQTLKTHDQILLQAGSMKV